MATVRELLVRIRGDGAELEKELNSSVRRIDAFGRRAERIGRDLTLKFTAPIVAAGAAATKMSVDFDTEMTKIVTLVGVGEEQVDDWRRSLVQMGPEIGKGPRELARALFVVTSAGERGAAALDIVERAGKASALGLGETADIARTVTAAMQAYSSMGLTAERATDILVATVREGNVEASSLAGALGRVLGTAAQLGVTFDQVGGFIATFTRLGIGAEESVVALRGVLSTIQKPTAAAEQALGQMDMTVQDLRRSIADRGLTATLIDLVQRAKETGTEMAAVIPNVRALSGVLGTAGVQAEAFEEITGNVSESMGILDDAFARLELSPAQTFAQLRATLEAIAITMGDALAPALNDVLRAAIPFLRTIQEIDSETIKTTAKLLGLVAVIGPLMLGMGSAARTAATLARTLLMARAAGVALSTTFLPAAALMVGLGLLVARFVDIQMEAAKASLRIAELRAEFAAMSQDEQAERLVTLHVDTVEAQRELDQAEARLAAIQQDQREMRGTGGLGVQAAIEVGDASREAQELRDRIADLKSEQNALIDVMKRDSETRARWNAEQAESREEIERLLAEYSNLGDAAEGAGEKLRESSEVLAELEDRLATADALGELSGEFDAGQLKVAAYRSALEELVQIEGQTGDATQRVAGELNDLTQRMGEQEEILRNLNTQLEAADRLGAVASDSFDSQAMSVSAYESALQSLIELGLNPTDPAVRAVALALGDLRDDMAANAEEAQRLEQAHATAMALIAAARTPAEEYQAVMEALALAYREGKIEAEEFAIAQAEARRQFEDSAASMGSTWQDQFAAVVVSSASNVQSSFSAMAQSILRDVARVIARLLVMRAIMAAFAPFAGGSGLGAAIFNVAAQPFGGGRARGGPVQTGRTYIVGEQGPEVFSPGSNGQIIPNHALAGAGAGGGGGGVTLDFSRFPAARNPIAAARDDDWQMFLRESMDEASADGYDPGRR